MNISLDRCSSAVGNEKAFFSTNNLTNRNSLNSSAMILRLFTRRSSSLLSIRRSSGQLLQRSSTICGARDYSAPPPTTAWEPMEGVVRCPANYVPLSPISFLERSAVVYGDRTSLVSGSIQYTWSQTHERCLRVASALAQMGISRGDVVATLAYNVPAMYELHFAVPMAGAILCTLNARYDAAMVSTLLKHSQTKVIFVDTELHPIAREAIHLLRQQNDLNLPTLILVSEFNVTPKSHPNDEVYEDLVEEGSSEFEIRRPISELDPISINYTSGTTSRPKGVVYSHRGAYLNSIATFLMHDMGSVMPVYLWTVPMFHCNGWCLTWGVAAQGGTNICIRKVCPEGIFDNILHHNVTHMGGAPTVLNMIVNCPEPRTLPHQVNVMTGGSPPPPQILARIEDMGFRVSHLYGLTEVYGPGTHCVWKPEWDSLPADQKSKMKARQGVRHLGLEAVDVMDPVTMKSVPDDGKTLGEVVFRGNTVMSGYYKDTEATKAALKGGWFWSGDIAVKHHDGYLEVKDRSKDVIISGGENISSVEVETVLYSHPSVLEAAVVARPDNHWGQTPCAFVKLKDGCEANEKEIIEYCRDNLPHYMAPRSVVFDELPRTSTGKIQKFVLREKAKALGSLSRAKAE